MRQISLLLIAVVGSACATSGYRYPTECPPRPAAGWEALDTTSLGKLNGQYELILVSSWEDLRGRSVRGPLTLHATENFQRYYEPSIGRWHRSGKEPLWGWADISLDDVEAGSSADPSSRDPGHPGVLVHANGSLELGVWRGLDGVTTDLQITHVAPGGFRGSWIMEIGLAYMERNGRRVANPHGYFCAVRVGAS